MPDLEMSSFPDSGDNPCHNPGGRIMTMPTLRDFRDEDAQNIQRFPMAGAYQPFEPTGPAFTLEVDGEAMACIGYEREENAAKCWMILSTNSVKHPNVFRSIKILIDAFLDEAKGLGYERLITAVDINWPEAQRFVKWMKFTARDNPVLGPDGKFYTVYERVV